MCGCVVDIMVYMSIVNVVCAGCVVDIMVYMSIVNVVCAGCVVDTMVYMATVNSSKETWCVLICLSIQHKIRNK